MSLIYAEDGKAVAYVLNVRRNKVSKYGDSVDYCYTLKVLPGVSLEEVQDALRLNFNTHCTHSYDCCGHWYSTVYANTTLRHVKRREYTVTVNYHQNI